MGRAQAPSRSYRRLNWTGRVDQYYAYAAGSGEDPDGRMSAESSIKAIAKAKTVAMLNPAPDVRKVRRIVDNLLWDADGVLSVKQVKTLFAKLMGVNRPRSFSDPDP